jgi:membrane-bound lytic murein transglycosylase D
MHMTVPENHNSAQVKTLPITVRIETGIAANSSFSFNQPFRIGRDQSCEIQLNEPVVSRFHAEFWYADSSWWLLDLKSHNGTYLNGSPVEKMPLSNGDTIEIGRDGPIIKIVIDGPQAQVATAVGQPTLEELRAHYLEGTDSGEAGQRTVMIRQAFKQIQTHQRRKYTGIIAFCICVAIAAGIIAFLKHQQVLRQKRLAEEIFYAMKTLELEFAPMLKAARIRGDTEAKAQIEKYETRRMELQKRYDTFLDELDIYQKRMSEEERIILRMARVFGECEIKMPDGFTREVLNYIKKWKSTTRLQNAIIRAKENGYVETISENLIRYGLPPQFFYLPLQESGFNVQAVGPKTRYGIAKGIWQFIPPTAVYYGLKTGPLQDLRRYDPRDERHDFEKSTQAAVRYLRDIYDTEAQASGLLVMASYNWGERRVIKLILQMPENPQERNFWQLLSKYKKNIPRETYDYVFYIFSAAVIGENPQLFGFSFSNPLSTVLEK